MNGCTDKRFERMLSLYELDLLSPTEQEEFELHLLDCDHCFDRVERFKPVVERLHRSSGVRKTIDQVVREAAPVAEETPRPQPKRRWAALVPVSFAVIAIAVMLVLKPWQIEVRPTQEAIAAEHRLAVMYFNNISGNKDADWLGQAVTSLLITDLSESRYLQIVSSQRLYDLLRRLGHDDAAGIDRNIATRVAEEAGARWMLLGDIIRDEPELALSAQLVDVASGDVIASQRVIGSSEETVFSLVDSLSVLIRDDLGLSTAAEDESDPSVADITTHSAEAYRWYLEGIGFSSMFYWSEAAASFRKALEYDSTFAMAYYHLAGIEDRDLIAKALEYSRNASQKEQYYIRSREASFSGNTAQYVTELENLIERYPDEKEAYFRLGSYYRIEPNYERALGYLNRALEIDPLYKEVYNESAYLYDQMGDFERAMQAVKKYISLAPDEANPYDTRGEIYANNGMIDEAIESYLKAIEIKPDFLAASIRLANLYRFKRDYESAEYWYKEVRSETVEGVSLEELGDLANLYVDRGKLGEALRFFDKGWSAIADKYTTDNLWIVATAHAWRATMLEEIDLSQALREIETAIEIHGRANPQDSAEYRPLYARLLAESGDSAGADEVVRGLRRYLEASGKPLYPYWHAAGAVELSRGHAQQAVEYLEKSTDTIRPMRIFTRHYLLAIAYLQSGQISKAVRKFEEQIATYYVDRLRNPIQNAKMHYYLGIAYEKSHLPEKAAEQYRTLLGIWADADPNIKEIDDARRRLANLKSES